MTITGSRRFLAALIAAAAAGVGTPREVLAQPAPPPAPGRVIEAADGDVIVIGPSSRVAIVRRTQGQARLIHDAERGAVALVLVSPDREPGTPSGAKKFRSWRVGEEVWPLGPRWEGDVTIDEYVPSGGASLSGLAIHTDRGLLFIGHMAFPMTPPPAIVIRPQGMRASPAWGSFDEIEERWRTGGDDAVSRHGGVPHTAVALVGSVAASQGTPASPPLSAPGAVRVGGNVRAPMRTYVGNLVYPQQAMDAGVQGVVILEILVAADGSVGDARVLRSIPLLDQTAVEHVRQWRYEPTLLNGVAVPVIMTVTVNFTLSR